MRRPERAQLHHWRLGLSLSTCNWNSILWDSHSSSASRKAIQSDLTWLMPRFLAADGPAFGWQRYCKEVPYSRTTRAVPSVDPSSTTMTVAGTTVCRNTLSIARRIHCRALYAGIMTETSGALLSTLSRSGESQTERRAPVRHSVHTHHPFDPQSPEPSVAEQSEVGGWPLPDHSRIAPCSG